MYCESRAVGHVGGSLSIAEALSVLYSKHMSFDPKNPGMEGRDRLVLSKGHAGSRALRHACKLRVFRQGGA